MAMEEGGERHMFVSHNDCGEDHQALSVLDTEIHLGQGELQVRSDLGDDIAFEKSTK